MGTRSVGRAVAVALIVLVVAVLALGHIVFGLGNFRPGYPRGEGVASLIAGAALLASPLIALRSIFAALVTACLGTLPLVAWFAYAVPVEGSSSATFLWLSLILPVTTGLSAFLFRRRSRSA